MSDPQDPTVDEAASERPAPAEVFDLLRDETRCAIVRALFELSSDQWHRETVTFSDLRRAVGVEDGGRFNYHLGQLRGTLVECDQDGYRLTVPGHFVGKALLRGEVTGTDATTVETGECPVCRRTLSVETVDGYVGAECPDHGVVFTMVVPPTASERHDPQQLLSLAVRRADWNVELAMQGCCQECWAPLDVRAPVPSEETPIMRTAPGVSTPETYLVEFDCRRCNQTFWLAPGTCVVRHPAVIAFCWDHGQDALEGTLPLLEFANPFYPLVERTDAGVAVTIVRGDEELRVELDESATVVDATRRPTDLAKPDIESFVGEHHE